MSKPANTSKLIITSVVISLVVLAAFTLAFIKFIVPAYQVTEAQIFSVLIKLFPLLIGLVLIQIGVMAGKKNEEDYRDQVDKLPPNAYSDPLYQNAGDDPANLGSSGERTMAKAGNANDTAASAFVASVAGSQPIQIHTVTQIHDVPCPIYREKITEAPIEKIKVVTREVPVEVVKIVKEEVPVEVIKEVTKEVPVEVVREVTREVPIEVIKEVTKEVPVEVIKEVVKEVPVEVIKEVTKEVPVEVIKEVIKEVPVEVIKEVPVEVVKEVVKEVPVEVIKEVPREVPVEVIKEVEKQVEIPIAIPAQEKEPEMYNFTQTLDSELASAQSDNYDLSLLMIEGETNEDAISAQLGTDEVIFNLDGKYAMILPFYNANEAGRLEMEAKAKLTNTKIGLASTNGRKVNAETLTEEAERAKF